MPGLLSTPEEWKAKQANTPGLLEWLGGAAETAYEGVGDAAGFVTDSLMLPVRKGGELLEAGYEGAKANMAEHPIYGNVGTAAGNGVDTPTPSYQEREAAYEQKKVDAQAQAEKNSPEAMAARVAAMRAPNEGESQTETAVRNKIIDSVESDPTETPETQKVLKDNPNASTDEVVAAKSKDGYNSGKKAILQQGGTPEDLSAWDKFNEDYDLTTIGLSLLMTNQGGGNLSTNLGMALTAGRQYKVDQADKAAATAKSDRDEARADRGLDIDADKAETTRYSAQATAAYQKAKIEADLQIAQIRAAGDAAGAGGITIPNKTEQDAINTFVDAKVKQGGFGAELADPSVQVKYAMNVKQALELAPPGTDPQKVMDDVWNATITEDTSWNSIGPTYK